MDAPREYPPHWSDEQKAEADRGRAILERIAREEGLDDTPF